MNKIGGIIFCLILILSVGVVSASLFSDIKDKITGKAVDASEWCSLDVDENGRVEAATDVVYISRGLLGLPAVPASFRNSTNLTILSDQEILANINLIKGNLDVDENGETNVATDIVYISRTLLGLVSVPASFRNSTNLTILSDEKVKENVEKLKKSWSGGKCGEVSPGECVVSSDCPSKTANYCDEDGRACQSVKNYICENYICVSQSGGGGCRREPCPNGCSDGVCLNETSNITTCTDSDGGKNYEMKGTVTIQGVINSTDTCFDQGQITEYYCRNGSFAVVITPCFSGNCSDGACVGDIIGGDEFVKIERVSDRFNLGDSAASVLDSLDDGDLPTLLAEGTYMDDNNNEYDYVQRIIFGSNLGLEYFSDNDYKDKEPTIGIRMSANEPVLNYSLDFILNPEYSAETLETTTLTLLRKKYYVLNVENNGSRKKLTLLDQIVSGVVREGEDFATSGYKISIEYISSTHVKLSVNGEVTNLLGNGATFRLSDGTYVGVRQILYDSIDTGVSKVEVSIGKEKLELIHGNYIELNDNTINEITNFINLDSSNNLDKIILSWRTNNEEFITGESDLSMPGFEYIKFSMNNFYTELNEKTTVRTSGTNVIEISTSIKDGNVTIPILFANSSGSFIGSGKASDNKLFTSLNSFERTILFNETAGYEYIIASYNSSQEGESYYLRVDMVTEDNVNKVRFTDKVTGTEKVAANGSSVSFGSVDLIVNNVTRNGAMKWATIQINNGGDFSSIYTKGGLKINLPYNGVFDVYNLSFVEEDKGGNLANGKKFSVVLGDNSDNEVHVRSINMNGINDIGQEIGNDTKNYKNYLISNLATQSTYYTGGDQDTVDFTYHGSEAYGNLYFGTGDIVGSSGGSSGGGSGRVEDTPELYLDETEPQEVQQKSFFGRVGDFFRNLF